MSKPVYLDYNATTPVAPEVLAAMGCDANRALGAVRLSLGRMSTPEEIEAAATALSEAVNGLLLRRS